MLFRRNKKNGAGEIAPDEIFLDSSNLPLLDPEQFEGRVEHPVSRFATLLLGSTFALALIVFSVRAFDLQIVNGELYAEASEDNRLSHSVVFANRGILYDRYDRELAWNDSLSEEEEPSEYSKRRFADLPGLAHTVGFVRYPRRDTSGFWWRTEISGVAGMEAILDDVLRGINGKKIVEVNAHGEIHREQIIEPAIDGTDVHLSIDAVMQSKLHEILSAHAARYGFEGGASVILDVRTGEVLALVSFPEYDQQAMTDGDTEAVARFNEDLQNPFLNRAIGGLYAPGSIVKPVYAVAALVEGIISPDTAIYSAGQITIPNPFDPSNPTIMRDWRAHGWTDMRESIAVSSDVYFYSIGGGYEDQLGLGIERLEQYARKFGFGEETGIRLSGELEGVIPTPEWKADVFDDAIWRVGDTYNMSIGQFGFQATPIQAARATAAIAGGRLLTPHMLKDANERATALDMSDTHLQVAREGMRLAVTSSLGTARALSIQGFPIAAKTGTAEVGSQNQYMHSWSVGFWPVNDPQYAFATVLERAPAGTSAGASPAMRPFFEWFMTYDPTEEVEGE